jgi:hypothetical protein
MSVPANAFCELTIVDADGRARVCGGLAVTTRTVNGVRRFVCAACAPCHDKGEIRDAVPIKLPPTRGPAPRRRR